MTQEESASVEFRRKPQNIPSKEKTGFNGINIRREKNGQISIDKKDKIRKLEETDTQKGFASKRAMCQYSIEISYPTYARVFN